MSDELHPFILEGVNLRGAVLDGTRLVGEMRRAHELGPLETLILGQAYIAAGLLSLNLKGRDRLSLRIECDGPLAGLSAETNAAGDIRGYLFQNPVTADPSAFGGHILASLWGPGTLTISRFPEGAKTPFTGQVKLESGSMAKSLARYFLRSEQTPAAFVLSVSLDRSGTLRGAGGLFLQTLPGADETVLGEVEEKLSGLPSPGSALAGGVRPEEYVENNFGRYFPRLLESRRAEFFCPCSAERFAGWISSLPWEDLADMAENGPFPVRTTCHNCNSVYEFSRKEIRDMLERRGEK